MQEDQKGRKKTNVRAEGEQITAAPAKQHDKEEEDTRYWHKAGGEGKRKGTKRETRQNEQNNQNDKSHCYRFRAPSIERNETQQKLPLTVKFRPIDL